MRELLQDLRYGARLLVSHLGFTSVVVATLALAIGANTVIFSITNFLLLRPLPFQDPDTVAAVWSVDPLLGNDRALVSDADLLEWRHEAQSFVALGGFADDTHTMTGRGDAERLQSMRITANLFDIWGIQATAGRRFQAGDDTPGAAPVVMLADGFWRRRFGADPGIVGDTLVLDATPHTVVGIVTPEMELGTMSLTDIWVPYVLDPQAPRDTRRLAVYGRLEPGVGIEAATAEIATIAERQARDNPVTSSGWSAQVMPLLQAMTGSNAWVVLSLLVLVVSFVLIIACANIANLMLARGVGRRKELAVRAAIGAGRFRLVRQLLAESLLFGMAGGLLGLVVAEGGLRAIKAVTYEPFFKQIEMDYRVLAFVALLSIVTPVLFASLPALSAARMNLSEVIGEGEGRTSGGRRGRRSRNALVIAQLSLAATLLVLSTLIIQVAAAQSRLDVGFDPTNVLTLQIELDGPRYGDDEAVRQFGDAAVERLEGLPGVARAAIASTLPVF
ncbi:MAG TPA: ABC transporter permease, partial [Vicinamibacterales bacterium]|nr:ABC transporter permease [Vicinamibacterales bacterium]